MKAIGRYWCRRSNFARELANKGFEVLILEAGGEFKPFTRRISLVEPQKIA